MAALPKIITGARPHRIENVPAPNGGINARDGISIMPETDAINLVNWIPDTYGCRTRKGFREWAINFPTTDAVKSVLHWMGVSSTFPGGSFLDFPTTMPGKVFAAQDAAIYEITNATNTPVSSKTLSGTVNAGWLHSTMLTNIAGSFLCVCSETDGYFYYDGTVWTTPTMGGGAGQIANVNPADLVYPIEWKKRLWFVERASTRAWYLPTEQITGSATSFDFGPQFKNGGHLSFLARWTLDAGEGIDDFLVAVSSMGDVVVYKGSDPSASATFGMVGSWSVGQIPVGRRCHEQYGGDLIILSTQGIMPISMITRGGSSVLQATGQEYSSAIRTPLSIDLSASFTQHGWQLCMHPTERLLLCSVPDYGAVRNKQYAMSTVRNKWCIFDGMPITCYKTLSGFNFGGTPDGRVLLNFSTYFDETPYGGTVGQAIRGIIIPAFTQLKSPGMSKQIVMARPMFLAIDEPALVVDINVNYSVSQPFGAPSAVAVPTNEWDVGDWDKAIWGGEAVPFSEWVTVNGLGYSATLGMVTSCVAETVFLGVDYMILDGGPF